MCSSRAIFPGPTAQSGLKSTRKLTDTSAIGNSYIKSVRSGLETQVGSRRPGLPYGLLHSLWGWEEGNTSNESHQATVSDGSHDHGPDHLSLGSRYPPPSPFQPDCARAHR